MTKKIIVTAVKAGGGHIAAMNSIISALSNSKEYQIESFTSANNTLNKLHEFFNFKLPIIYDIGYNIAEFKASRISQDILIQDVLNQFKYEFIQFFEDEQVEKIISTHFLTTQALLELKEELDSKIKIIAYVPDYDVSLLHFPYSDAKYLNGLIAQSYSFIDRVANEFNYPRHRMQKAGFVVNSPFEAVNLLTTNQAISSLSADVKELKQISKTKLRIVIAGGSGWTGTIAGKIKKLISYAENDLDNVQFIVISGSSEESIKRYNKIKKHYPKIDLVILPQLNHNDLSKIYKIADIVLLASIAPASLFELMHANSSPLILVKANPGQEFFNKNFAVEEGLIELSTSQDNLNWRVIELVEDINELARVKKMYASNFQNQLQIARLNADSMSQFIINL